MKSIQTKMMLIFSLVILLSGSILAYTIYRSSTALIVKSIGNQAKTITENASKIIDPELFMSINPDTGENEYYHYLREELNKLRESNGLQYLYTMGLRKNNGTDEYFYIVDGMPEGAEDASALGDVEDEMAEYPDIIKAFETGEIQVGELSYTQDYGALLSAYSPIKAANGDLLGIIGADFDATEIYLQLEDNKKKMIWTTLSFLVIGLVIVFFFSRMLVIPLKQLATNVEKISTGDLTVDIRSTSKDEIGVLTRSVQTMVDQLHDMIKAISMNATDLAHASNTLSSVVDRSKHEYNQILSSIDEVAIGADSQMIGANESAQSSEQMSIGINKIVEHMSLVTNVSADNVVQAEQGNVLIMDSIEQMNTIERSVHNAADMLNNLQQRSQEIEMIVDVINQIAEQTNLLALNASIEAARAGEEGRGFAVVAGEVKKLAEQTAQSTQSISDLIRHIQTESKESNVAMNSVVENCEQGIDKVNLAGQVFSTIVQSIENVNSQFQEISAISEEISASTEEVAASVQQMATVSETTASKSRHVLSTSQDQLVSLNNMAESAHKLSEMAQALNEMASKFKV